MYVFTARMGKPSTPGQHKRASADRLWSTYNLFVQSTSDAFHIWHMHNAKWSELTAAELDTVILQEFWVGCRCQKVPEKCFPKVF